MKTIVVTYAVKEECIPLNIEGCKLIFVQTGIGKTRSASLLTKQICMERPDFVLNIGTAGTLTHRVGDIFIANRFIDRDYEAIRLPGVEYEIDGAALLGGHIALKDWVAGYKKRGICSTGDTFITTAASFYGDVIDMEAYAQAFVCREFNVPFLSVKYITDIVGQNSVGHWESKLSDACAGLTAWIKEQPIESLLVEL